MGRRIVDGIDPVKIFGELVPVKAKVESINALSAHADRNGLMEWVDEIKDNVRHAFAIHGEPDKVTAMGNLLKERGIAHVAAPYPGQTYKFD